MSDENRPQDEQLNNYRLVIMNDETFEEISSFQVSKPKVYLAVFGILFGVTVLVWSLISFTPLKYLLFGNGDHNIRQDMVDISIQIDSLEQALEDRDHYIKNMRAVLTGNLESAITVAEDEEARKKEETTQIAENMAEAAVDNPEEKSVNKSTKPMVIAPNREDSVLRARIDREDEFAVPYSKPIGDFNAVKIAAKREQSLDELYFTPPIRGYITEDFQPAKDHFGIDIAATKNTPIKSSLDGVVVVSNWTLKTGNIIGIQHDHNLISFYKHNSVLLKKVGSFVKAGEAIAIIGNTGQLSDGPHLHFEIWQNGQPLNPANYINF